MQFNENSVTLSVLAGAGGPALRLNTQIIFPYNAD